MSSNLIEPAAALHPAPKRAPRERVRASQSSAHATLLAHGEPMVWLTGGSLAVCVAMVVSLIAFILVQGVATFWPAPLIEVHTLTHGVMLGEDTRQESYRPEDGTFADLAKKIEPQVRAALAADPPPAVSALDVLDPSVVAAARAELPADRQPSTKLVASLTGQIVDREKAKLSAKGVASRRSLRTGNFELTQSHFHWVDDYDVIQQRFPEWAVVLERLEKGRFYGTPEAFLIDGKVVASEPAEVWQKFEEFHDPVRARWQARVELEERELGAIRRRAKAADLDVVQADLDHGKQSPEYATALQNRDEIEVASKLEESQISLRIKQLDDENDRYRMRFRTAEGEESTQAVAGIVRAYPANRLSMGDKIGIYFSRWKEFLLDGPRNANTEGGVLPAIWGTVAMTLIMSILVVPFGVMAALYLREYAKAGPLTSAVRISINNLAGVPSIVFGVFGLGFFCYVVGAGIDNTLFRASVAQGSPVFGTGGLMWASFTLALLTLPVVIVATEEALSAVPNSMREGSYACGASKWQTIWRIVLPRALPGIMTGTILAMARGAGEVAPLMLVGVVKLAPELPVDRVFPFFHPQRSFMHLGFHIYDVGFQSPNSEAAKPMVYTTTLLLIAIIACLNIAAIWLRNRLRRKFISIQF